LRVKQKWDKKKLKKKNKTRFGLIGEKEIVGETKTTTLTLPGLFQLLSNKVQRCGSLAASGK